MSDEVVRDHEIGIIWADDEDLRKIYAYVSNLRSEAAANNPAALILIDGFRDWYGALGWYDVHVMINDTMKEAISRRNTIDTIMRKPAAKAVLPEESFFKDLVTPDSNEPEAPPIIPTKWKVIAGTVALALGAGFIAKKVYLDPFTKRL